jgi:hypothetical protein
MTLAVTEPTDASQDLVLYGLDDKAKPRAGLVPGADRDVALPIAADLKFQLLPISTAQRRILAAELSPVCLSENGYSAVPAIGRALFADIENTSQQQENLAPELVSPPSAAQACVSPWDTIKIGQVVLSQEENPKDGWWEAIVLNELDEGDSCFAIATTHPSIGLYDAASSLPC